MAVKSSAGFRIYAKSGLGDRYGGHIGAVYRLKASAFGPVVYYALIVSVSRT